MEKEQLQQILSQFGLTFREITALHDTSWGENDKRLNYILDEQYVLKINSLTFMSEERLQEISRLIERYHAIGVYCPHLIPSLNGQCSVIYEIDGIPYICFVEEFAKYPVCDEKMKLDDREVVAHLGKLASTYTDVDLSDNYSIWTIFDLAPWDEGVDQKQENANELAKALEEAGEGALARKVLACNDSLRAEILKDFRQLPRCVFQGDLNSTNHLHENGHFAGIIDFNMSGTDVNINVFACETNQFPLEREFDSMTAAENVVYMNAQQEKLLDVIWASYTMNPVEQRLLPCFLKLCNLFMWPNVRRMCQWLQEDERRDKALELLRALVQ